MRCAFFFFFYCSRTIYEKKIFQAHIILRTIIRRRPIKVNLLFGIFRLVRNPGTTLVIIDHRSGLIIDE